MIDDNDLTTNNVVKVATDVCILICVHAGVVLILYDKISVYNFKDRNFTAWKTCASTGNILL